MNINSIFYSPNFQTKAFAKKSVYAGMLAPLKADAVSFRGSKIAQNAHIHLEWIDNKSIRDLVERLLSPNGKPNSLKKSEVESLLKYFGFDMDNWTDSGDDRKYHRTGHSKLDNYFTVNQHKDADKGMIQDLRDALMIIDDMNGELICTGNKHRDKDFYEKFKEQTQEYSPDNTNRYRKYWQADYDNKLQQEKLKQEQELEAQRAALEEEKRVEEISQTQQKQDEAIEFGKKLEIISYIRLCIEEAKKVEAARANDMESLMSDFKEVKDSFKIYGSLYKQEISEIEKDINEFYKKNKDDINFKIEIRKLNSIEREFKKYNSDAEIASDTTAEKLEEQRQTAEKYSFAIQERYEEFDEQYQQLTKRIIDLMSNIDGGFDSGRIAKFEKRLEKRQKIKDEIVKKPSTEAVMLQRIESIQNSMTSLSKEVKNMINVFDAMLDTVSPYAEDYFPDNVASGKKILIEYYNANLSQEELDKYSDKVQALLKKHNDNDNKEIQNDVKQFAKSSYVTELFERYSITKEMLANTKIIINNYIDKYTKKPAQKDKE